MLQNMRKNIQGPTTKIVVWLIVISFSIFGIESILVGGGGGGVAEVNGEEITPGELQQAVNTQKRRLISMMGDNIDPAMLDDDFLGPQALESLINRKLLTQSAEELGLAVSNREIGALIGGMEQFQIDGRFSPQLYTSVLSSAGYTPAYFKQTLQQDVALTQLRSGLVGSEFATPLELVLNAQLDAEQRDLYYLTIPIDGFLAAQEASQQEVQAYYDTHQNDFRTPESVELDYIELSPEQFLQPVEEELVLEAFQLELDSGQYQTEHRVSHILFEPAEGESEEQLMARVAAAQSSLDAGAEFGEVAREYSDDVGSAGNGGDLGYTSGDAFPAEMEEAIALLELNVISAPVTTDAGIHLIKVTDRKEGAPPTLEQMRPQLEQQIALSEARVELLRTVEELKDLAFNAADLSGPAAELQLEVQRSEAVTRDQAEGLFASASLLSVAFSEDVLDAGHNSDVIELGGDRFVVMRVRNHNMPEVKPLSEVESTIASIIEDEAARAEVAAAAQSAAQAVLAGASIEEVANEAGYNWQVELAADRRNTTLPPEVLDRAFALPEPAEGAAVVDVVVSAFGDARVIALQRVNKGRWDELEPASQLALQRRLTTEYADLLDREYQRGLRESADISVM